MDSDTEEWRPVIGFEGHYEVSSHGRIRSLDRQVMRGGRYVNLSGRVLRPQMSAKGYCSVKLPTPNGQKTFEIHPIVARAFIGPRPNGLVTRHWDGNGTNNRADNLLYGTEAQNRADSRRHGTIARGERAGRAIITADLARQIFDLKGRHKQTEIAELLGVSRHIVADIHTKRRWAHLFTDGAAA